MLPVQVSPDVLAELAAALDAVAASLSAGVSEATSDFGVVVLPRHGFAATHATDETMALVLRTVTAIEIRIADTAASVRRAAAAYASVDGSRSSGPITW